MRALHAIFAVLSAISVPLLWMPMLLNGTLDDISNAKKLNVLPDGAPLKTIYLGIAFLDDLISTLIAFFYAVGSGSYLGPRLMLSDLASTLHVALAWMVIESLRKGQKSWYLRMPGLLGVLWNVAGAGIVLPLFCLWHLTTPVKDARITDNHAKSLPLAVLVSSIPFWMMVLPPAVEYSTNQHQNIIAVFQIAPLICVAAQYIFAFLFGRLRFQKQNPLSVAISDKNAKFYLMATHLFLALYSAVFHLICVFTCIFSSDPSATLLRVFLPNPRGVDHGSPFRLTQGAILFLQYDWVIICLTSILYSYLLLEPYILSDRGRKIKFMEFITFLPVEKRLSSVATLTLLTVAFGPSTSVSLALWQREKQLGTQTGFVNGEGGRPIKRA